MHKLTPVLLSVALLGIAFGARAELRPDRVHVADSKKNQSYIRDGLITGGDKAINEVVVRDIRRAANPGYERIVVDLEGTHNGEPAAIQRPPFYQVSVTPDEKRIVFTIWGHPRLDFNSRRVAAAFRHSSVVQGIELLPRVEDNTWTFVFQLRGDNPVEVFELSNPVRIIMDVKAGRVARLDAEDSAEAEPVRNPIKLHHPRKHTPKVEVRPAIEDEHGEDHG